MALLRRIVCRSGRGGTAYAGAIGVGDVTGTGLWRDGALLTTGIYSATAFAATRWDTQFDIGRALPAGRQPSPPPSVGTLSAGCTTRGRWPARTSKT